VSEYLSEEEQVARLKSWWDENGNFVIAVTVLSIIAIVGWRWYNSYSLEQSYAASALYDEYKIASDESKVGIANTLASDHEGSAYHVFVLFDQAQDGIDAGELALAETALSRILAVGDDELLTDLARIRLAKVQFGLEQPDSALATLAAVSNEGYRGWALEAQGDIYAAQNNLAAAHESYQAAVDALLPGDERPFLNMKLENLAPFEGSYVEFSNPLADALRDALEDAEQSLVQEAESVSSEPSTETATEAANESAIQAVEGDEQVNDTAGDDRLPSSDGNDDASKQE